MAQFDGDLLPMPISFLERINLAKHLWKTVYDESRCPELDHCLRINSRGLFEARCLLSDDDSFYKSLSLYIFGVEDFSYMIHKAVLKYARNHNDELMNTFNHLESFRQLSCTVSEYMNEETRTERQASYIDVCATAHLLQTPIVLLRHQTFEVVNPNGVWNTDDDRNAILLATRPTGDDETFLFSPIVSYMRDLTAGDEYVKPVSQKHTILPSAELKYSVALLDKHGNEYVNIPFIVVRNFSERLAEFCGDVIESKMSIDALRRLKSYMLNPDKELTPKLDFELYQFARCWDIHSLHGRIDEHVQRSSLADVVDFVNHVSLRQHSQLYESMHSQMYHACLDELKNIRIQHSTDVHRRLNDYLSNLITCKTGLLPLVDSYQLPDVVLSLNTSASSCLGKFYNGDSWCTFFVPDAVKSVAPFLKDNTYCMMDDTLYFIKDSKTLGEMQLVNDHKGEIRFTRIPSGVSSPRIATTCHPNVLLLLSHEAERQVAEVTKASDGITVVSPWRDVERENYAFAFVGRDCILYTIEDYRCALKTDTANDTCSMFSVDSIDSDKSSVLSLHCYNIDASKELEQEDRVSGKRIAVNVHVPQSSSGPYLLMRTNVFRRHTKKCY